MAEEVAAEAAEETAAAAMVVPGEGVEMARRRDSLGFP